MKNMNELDMQFAKVPAAERNTATFQNNKRILMQRKFDALYIHKGITMEEMQAGVKHFNIKDDDDVKKFTENIGVAHKNATLETDFKLNPDE